MNTGIRALKNVIYKAVKIADEFLENKNADIVTKSNVNKIVKTNR